MPYSLVFHCLPVQDLDTDSLKGMALRDFVFRLFDWLDPELGRQIAGARARPFTVSPFFAKRSSSEIWKGHDRVAHRLKGKKISAGTPCRFRLTVLEDRLHEDVARLVGMSAATLSIDEGRLRLTHVISSHQTSDPWPRSQTHRQMLEEASSTCKELRLQFATPTMFRHHGVILPLPDPQSTFKGFLRSWNGFASIPLSTDLEKLIDRHVSVSDFRISASHWDMGEGIRPSFTGWCEFALLGRHHEKHIKEFNLLADYGFYCGTGDHTDMGMGVTRRI